MSCTASGARVVHLLVERIDYDGATGKLRIGAPGDPGARVVVLPAPPGAVPVPR